MRYWDDIARALEDVDPVCPSRASAAALWKTITADGSEKPDPQESPERMAQVLSTVVVLMTPE